MQNRPRRSILAAGAALATGGVLASVGSSSARAGCCQKTLAESNDWSSYRGNAGRSRSVPADGGFDEPDTVAWQYDERGAFAIGDGTVYVRTGSEVHALDAADGSVEWTSGDLGGIGGYPAVADGTVYVGGAKLTALDASSGDVRWSHEFDGDWLAPLVAFETVYALVGGSLYAFDAADGSVRWRRDAVDVDDPDGSTGSSANAHSFSTGRSCVVATDGTLWAALDAESPGAMARLDPQTGDVQWAEYLDPTHGADGLAATANKIFVEDTAQETGYAFDIASGEITGSVGDALWISAVDSTAVSLWRDSLTATNVDEEMTWSKQHSYAFGYPVIVGDTVVVPHSEEDPSPADEDASDELVAFDLVDGSEKWRFEFDDAQWKGAYRLDCGIAGDTIYVNREDGLTAVRRSGAEPDVDDDGGDDEDDSDRVDERDDGENGEDGDATDDGDEYETAEDAGEATEDGTQSERDGEEPREAAENATADEGAEASDDGDASASEADESPGFTSAAGVVGSLLGVEWLRRRGRKE